MKSIFKYLITTLLLLSNFQYYFASPYGMEIYWEHTNEKRKKERPVLNAKSYKVIGVKDGDTIVILVDGVPLTVRLNHIDCPEKKQDFGTRAKVFVSDHCFNRRISLKHNNKYDHYDRLLAEIILPNGDNLNKELVRNGLAWHFKKHSKDAEYATLEEKARQMKVGIWSYANPVAPWDWRKLKKK